MTMKHYVRDLSPQPKWQAPMINVFGHGPLGIICINIQILGICLSPFINAILHLSFGKISFSKLFARKRALIAFNVQEEQTLLSSCQKSIKGLTVLKYLTILLENYLYGIKT